MRGGYNVISASRRGRYQWESRGFAKPNLQDWNFLANIKFRLLIFGLEQTNQKKNKK